MRPIRSFSSPNLSRQRSYSPPVRRTQSEPSNPAAARLRGMRPLSRGMSMERSPFTNGTRTNSRSSSPSSSQTGRTLPRSRAGSRLSRTQAPLPTPQPRRRPFFPRPVSLASMASAAHQPPMHPYHGTSLLGNACCHLESLCDKARAAHAHGMFALGLATGIMAAMVYIKLSHSQ